MKKLKNKIVIYQGKNGEIKFRGDFSKDTIWGTQKQIADVFGVERSVITKHVNNIFSNEELNKKAVCANFAHTAEDGKTYNTNFYNLDIILAVGYRTNSAKAIEFRKWATKILKQHITKGYTINPKIIEKNYQSFMDAVEKVQRLLPKGNKISNENILELIKSFASTWFSLESFDEDNLPQNGYTKKDVRIQVDQLYKDIEIFKRQLIKKKLATGLFAQERSKKGLEGIIGNVFQAVFGTEVYETIEEKAAHLLYFSVKNHPFSDGNKRTGAFIFIWFLNKIRFDYRNKITPEALTAITLFIAESKPQEKDKMIGLILLMLKK